MGGAEEWDGVGAREGEDAAEELRRGGSSGLWVLLVVIVGLGRW